MGQGRFYKEVAVVLSQAQIEVDQNQHQKKKKI